MQEELDEMEELYNKTVEFEKENKQLISKLKTRVAELEAQVGAK